MAGTLRQKTKYPGVFYREAARIGGPGIEKVYYIVFKQGGKVFEEKVGRQYSDDMTPARANTIRAERIEGKRQSRKEIREEREAELPVEPERWPILRIPAITNFIIFPASKHWEISHISYLTNHFKALSYSHQL